MYLDALDCVDVPLIPFYLSLQRKPRSTLCIHSIISCSSWQSSFVNHSGYEDKSPAEKKLRMQSLTAIYLTNFLSAVGFSIMVRSTRAGKAPQCGAVCTGVAWLTCVCTCALCTRQSRCIYYNVILYCYHRTAGEHNVAILAVDWRVACLLGRCGCLVLCWSIGGSTVLG